MDAWQDANTPMAQPAPNLPNPRTPQDGPRSNGLSHRSAWGLWEGRLPFFLGSCLCWPAPPLAWSVDVCLASGKVRWWASGLCSPYDSLARIDETILRYSVFLVWLRHATNIGLLCSSMPYLDLSMSSNARNKDMFRCLGVSFSGLHSSSATTSTPPQPVSRRVCTVVGQIPSDQRPVGLEARFSTSRLKPIAAPLPTSVGLQVEFRQPSEDGGHHVPFQRQSGPYARQGCQSTCAMFAKLNDRQLGQVSRNLAVD